MKGYVYQTQHDSIVVTLKSKLTSDEIKTFYILRICQSGKKHLLFWISTCPVPCKQVVEDGYEFFAKRQLVTLFSAPNYCGEFDNAGAMMSVDDTLMCSFQVCIMTLRTLQMYNCLMFIFYFTSKINVCSVDHLVCHALAQWVLTFSFFSVRFWNRLRRKFSHMEGLVDLVLAGP